MKTLRSQKLKIILCNFEQIHANIKKLALANYASNKNSTELFSLEKTKKEKYDKKRLIENY